MRKIETLEMALERIKELEAENQKLNEELEYYRNRKVSGRQKHNDKWQSIYNDFVVLYESGMSIAEIAKEKNWAKELSIDIRLIMTRWWVSRKHWRNRYLGRMYAWKNILLGEENAIGRVYKCYKCY